MIYRSPYPNELWHHGILGQKWGVRRFQNPDGSLTDAGKKRYAKAWEREYKKPYHVPSPKNAIGVSNYNQIVNKPEVKLAYNHLKNVASDIGNELADYEKNGEYWQSISGAANEILTYGKSNNMYRFAQGVWFYANEDGDPIGYDGMNSVSIWAEETGKNKRIKQMHDEYMNASQEYFMEIGKAAEEFLGEYGNKKVDGITLSKSLRDRIDNDERRSDRSEFYYDYYTSGVGDSPYTKDEKAAVASAKKVVSLMGIGNKGNKTWNIVEAVENLGLSDTKFEDMTDSDWKKLGDELSRLGWR